MLYLNLMTQIYGITYGEMYKFGFYFVMRNINNLEYCKKTMQITKKEANMFEKKYKNMIAEMNQYFEQHNIANIAIYGLGNVGNAFLEVSDRLLVNIKYAIDQRKIKNDKIETYSLENNLPQVDAVIITLKEYNEGIEKKLNKLFCKVLYWKDISLKYWVNQEGEK